MDLDSRYELLEKIGSGSFAKVYRARDRELGREVAVKQIHEQYLDDPAQLDRFWQEAQLLASLSHPNIVTIYDLHRDRGWVIMELMQASLAERFENRQMPISSIRTTLAHGLRALKYLHARGIVHGDIKPSNLMIDSRRRIKIGDFGLARRVSDEDGSLIKGTTKYMAPEVVSEEFGEIGPASDLYSLGFCAYELMCGPNFETLFPGLSAFGRNKQIAWMMWHAAADRKLPPVARVLEGVPEDLAAVIEKLIDKDQAARYRTADQALADLKVDLKVVKSDDPDELEAEEDAQDQARKKRLVFAGGALAFSLVLSLVLLFSGGSQPPEPPKKLVRLVMEVFPKENKLKVEDLDRTYAKEIALGDDPRIFLTNSQKNIVPREIQPGDRIEIEQAQDDRGKTRLVITVSRPITNHGVVKDIDRPHRRIVVAVNEGSLREDLTLRVPEHAEIKTQAAGQSQTGHLRDLNLGDEVTVTHFDELGDKPGRFVVRLSVLKVEDGVGFVAEVDPQKRTLTITSGLNQNDKKRLRVAEGCEMTLAGTPITLADLKPKDRVRFRFDTEFRKILVLRDQTLSEAVVDDVRLDERQLQVSDAQGQMRTFHIPAGCEITLRNEPASLADLRKYDTLDLTWHESETLPAASSVYGLSRRVDEQRAALLIGIEKYDDPALTRLSFPVANIELLRKTLVDRYAFNPDRIEILTNPDRTQLRADVEQFLSGQGRSTQVIVYLCGHVYRIPGEHYVIAAKHFEWDRRAETGVPIDWLVQAMENCPSQNKLLLLDTCHPGLGADSMSEPSPETVLASLKQPPKTTTIIGNCENGERGFLVNEEQYSLFAHEVAKGFGGPADADRDLMIRPAELYRYLKSALKNAKIPGGKTQTPYRLGGE